MLQSSTALRGVQYHRGCPTGKVALLWEPLLAHRSTVTRSQTVIKFKDLQPCLLPYGILELILHRAELVIEQLITSNEIFKLCILRNFAPA